jgi:WD40 repeat protein
MLLIQDAWALPVAILPAGSLTLHDAIFGFDAVKVLAGFSPDGQRVLTASDDGTARVWDARTGQALGEPMEHPGSINSAQFSPDGRRVMRLLPISMGIYSHALRRS